MVRELGLLNMLSVRHPFFGCGQGMSNSEHRKIYFH